MTEQDASGLKAMFDNVEPKGDLEGVTPAPVSNVIGDDGPRYSMKRMRDEIAKAKAYARREALQEAAGLAYRTCAETRHVTLGDKARAAIMALTEEAAPVPNVAWEGDRESAMKDGYVQALATYQPTKLLKALQRIKEEATVANDVIRLNRDGGGNGRVKVATAMHRIAKLASEALGTPSPRSREEGSDV